MDSRSNHIAEKVFWFSLYALAFFFPFSNLLAKITIVVATAAWLVMGRYKNIRNEYFYFLLILSAYYFINFVGLIHSDNMATAWTRLETRLSYLLFPLIIFTTPYQPKNHKIIFWSFTFSVVGVSIAGIIAALFNSWQVVSAITLQRMSYVYLTFPLELHPTYVSFCVCIAIFFILTNFNASLPKRKLIALVALLIYLTAFLFLLLSRGVIIPFVIAITLSGLFYLVAHKNRKLILVLCGMLVIAFCSIFFVDVMRERFIAPFTNEKIAVTNNNQEESVALHLKSWYCASELLSDYHFFTGYGSGDEKDVLAACYEDHGWGLMLKERYNAHNEYLSCLLRNGIAEALILIIGLGTALFWSIRAYHLLYVSFSITFILGLLFTTINDFHAIVAFNFFNALLFVEAKNKYTQLKPNALK